MTVFVELRAMVREALAFVSTWRRRYAIAVLVFALMAMVTLQYDAAWVAAVARPQERDVKAVARWFSEWGDFRGTVIIAVTLALAGLAARRRLWRAALACLLAAGLAGMSANLVRTTVGRPRPMAKMPDGLYGPTMSYHFHGFPSAHAATSFGTATALVVAVPVVGVPALVAAGGVAWSRMHRMRHHPTDVLIGGGVGALFGIALGAAARRRERE